jgi:hypothetical protein
MRSRRLRCLAAVILNQSFLCLKKAPELNRGGSRRSPPPKASACQSSSWSMPRPLSSAMSAVAEVGTKRLVDRREDLKQDEDDADECELSRIQPRQFQPQTFQLLLHGTHVQHADRRALVGDDQFASGAV